MKEPVQPTVALSFDEDAIPTTQTTSQTTEAKLKFGRRKKVMKETD